MLPPLCIDITKPEICIYLCYFEPTNYNRNYDDLPGPSLYTCIRTACIESFSCLIDDDLLDDLDTGSKSLTELYDKIGDPDQYIDLLNELLQSTNTYIINIEKQILKIET